eukprot:833596-Rhodomonas_salina.2
MPAVVLVYAGVRAHEEGNKEGRDAGNESEGGRAVGTVLKWGGGYSKKKKEEGGKRKEEGAGKRKEERGGEGKRETAKFADKPCKFGAQCKRPDCWRWRVLVERSWEGTVTRADCPPFQSTQILRNCLARCICPERGAPPQSSLPRRQCGLYFVPLWWLRAQAEACEVGERVLGAVALPVVVSTISDDSDLRVSVIQSLLGLRLDRDGCHWPGHESRLLNFNAPGHWQGAALC